MRVVPQSICLREMPKHAQLDRINQADYSERIQILECET